MDLRAAETDEARVERGRVHVAHLGRDAQTRLHFAGVGRLCGRETHRVNLSRNLGAVKVKKRK